MLRNVEAELGSADPDNGCGCNDPDSVDAQTVAIAVVHGDAESLAGWRFGFEAMPPTRGEPKVQALAAPAHVTPAAGSPGHAGHFKRILQGPELSVRQDVRTFD